MSTPNKTTLTKPTDRELVFTRVFNAPRELVWQAWTEPKHIVRWWGPNGFTTTSGDMDVRPGGYWRLVMHGPDGRDYKNRLRYLEVIKPERLVYKHDGEEGDEPANSEITVTFETLGERTIVTMRMLFESNADREFIVNTYGADKGGVQTIERLGKYLPIMAAGGDSATTHALPADNELLLTRFFAAPRELMWQAWTDPKHLARWWGPRMFSTPICEIDPRAGGAYRVVMRGVDGVEYPVQGVYREFVEPERLVMVMDVSGHPADWHDMVKPNRDKSDTNPAGELITTVTLESHQAGTKLTIHVRFISHEVRDAMMKMGMVEGWTQSLDRLEELTVGN